MKAIGLLVLATLAFVSPCAYGQGFGIYLSTSFDQPNGNAYAFVETTADYSTGYYYYVCASVVAIGDRDDGTWDYYSSSQDCDSTDASISYPFSVPLSTDAIQFNGYHSEYVEYYTYQFDPYCSYYCSYYWDAYEMSLLGVGGGTYGTGTSWGLPGLPAISIGSSVFYEYTESEVGTWCYYPLYETSYYVGKSNPSTDMGYYGLFEAVFTPGSPVNYTGRSVPEAIHLSSEDCSVYGSFYDPITDANFNDSYVWSATQTGYGDDGDVDYIGVDQTWGDYFQSVVGGSVCLAFAGTQTMSMGACRNPLALKTFDVHSLGFYLGGSTMSAWRASATGAGQ